jgi:DnaJ-class molecular chaperone
LKINVEIPKRVSRAEKNLLEEIAKLRGKKWMNLKRLLSF